MSSNLRSTIRDQLLKVLSEGEVVDLSQYKSSKPQFSQLVKSEKKIYYLVLIGFIYNCYYLMGKGAKYLSFDEINKHPAASSGQGRGRQRKDHFNNTVFIIEVEKSFQEDLVDMYGGIDGSLHAIFQGRQEVEDMKNDMGGGYRIIQVNIVELLKNHLGVPLS